MVEIREVAGGRFEVFAEERHWEAFSDADRAQRAADALARQISLELGVEAKRVPVRRFLEVEAGTAAAA